MFVSVDLLGPTEMILSFAQYLSKYHVHPHMFSLMFVILDYTRKKSAEIIFFTGKVAFLFKKLCLQQIHRCYRNDLITSESLPERIFDPFKILREARHTRQYDKKWAKNFFHRDDNHVLKCLFLITSWVLKS